MEIFLGENKIKHSEKKILPEIVKINNKEYYKINNVDKMNPFFMTITSNSDHFMFISSTGGLTAGRKNPDNTIFPYYTDDKIHDTYEITGNKTIMIVEIKNKKYLWEPFSLNLIYDIQRNIYKNDLGNKIIFEEINNDLNITFQYSYENSEKYGFIKKSKIINKNSEKIKIDIIDGLQNILPYGVEKLVQDTKSTLIDGYKKVELIKDVNLGIYRLSSVPVDRAEPSEALSANVVWGIFNEIKNKKILLSSKQLNDFREGKLVKEEKEVKGEKGSYLVNLQFELENEKEWIITFDLNYDYSKLVKLIKNIKKDNIIEKLENDIKIGYEELKRFIALSDGIQFTNDKLNDKRHLSNVMFNIMRGGIFYKDYLIDKKDYLKYLNSCNKEIYNEFENSFNEIEYEINYFELINHVEKLNNPHLIRITLEYLPLIFSRRHGDPSRPWNIFNIDIKNEKGEYQFYYQGNWRDIFQNWESLAISYPGFIFSMITKFLNASTIDGYNPYRITKNGIDWELHDPEDPWSFIGYWGDHQIIYLLKLLELANEYYPEKLKEFLNKNIFTFANVPYRIKKYEDIKKDPQNTIDFDTKLNNLIEKIEKEIGYDAKFVLNGKTPRLVNFTEKLLVSLHAKIYNFILDAGIWMNTQRPEWNDANNALVGYGVSVVTLCYISRFLKFIKELYKNSNENSYKLSKELAQLTDSIYSIFVKNKEYLNNDFDDKKRLIITDELGLAGEKYREIVYKLEETEKIEYSKEKLLDLFDILLKFVDKSIVHNKKENGLYSAYNITNYNDKEMKVEFLYDMLEGQVAALSSFKLDIDEVIQLIEKMYSSELYRKDQESFMLYPDKRLPNFLEKNILPKEKVESLKIVQELLKENNETFIKKDIEGNYHFDSSFRNKNVLLEKLEFLSLNEKYNSLIKEEKSKLLDIYEEVFQHRLFTGRSGTFYKYEGLGSIYWHMVSKLVLAVAENIYIFDKNNVEKSKLEKLINYYYKIKEGLGIHKNPKDYGAFTTDPYSHTPKQSGVQQPGMTGQVKEDILSRFLELGIYVKNKEIIFNPIMLKKEEFINNEYLEFSFANTKIKYVISENPSLVVKYKCGDIQEFKELKFNKKVSNDIFNRSNNIEIIEVYLKL
ncbi:hypothetical protein EV215_0996 [Hypnocyclicus thermotrophus]|uniref:Cellobiose phosphorylase n=1 Tax=Hypnocyclicus thermotrophus TaxID=1627895 RepID=A0AA46DYH5_9FUSO|nr:hypothetical protein [Hypnocyclicus thermotrophus]TDT70451.1 hypothetical protein EV215_0996 [Hypnocyclicus thermotrophus]